MLTRKPILDRLADKFTVGDDCWKWTASLNSNGYGQLWDPEVGRARGAHRIVYEMMVGPIPDGLTLDHLCRNRTCVRPDHLEPVTNRENILRGESPSASHAKKTHCPRGHEYTPENTYQYARGRQCRTCVLAQQREKYHSAKAGK